MKQKYVIHCSTEQDDQKRFVSVLQVYLNKKILYQTAQPIDTITTREAEYTTLLLALKYCEANEYMFCSFLCSQAPSGQANEEGLNSLESEIKSFLSGQVHWSVEWVSNRQAHRLGKTNASTIVENFKQV